MAIPSQELAMALFPCTLHGGRYRGPQQSVYLTIAQGGRSLSNHLRLCPDCLRSTRAELDGALAEVDYDNPPTAQSRDELTCCWCGTRGQLAATFATVYADGAQEQTYYGDTCADCEQRMVAKFDLRPR